MADRLAKGFSFGEGIPDEQAKAGQLGPLLEQLGQQQPDQSSLDRANQSLPGRFVNAATLATVASVKDALRAHPESAYSGAAPLDPQVAGGEMVSRDLKANPDSDPLSTAAAVPAGVAHGLLTNPLTRRLLRGPIDMVAGREGQSADVPIDAVAEAIRERFEGRRGYSFGNFLGEQGPNFVGEVKLMQGARSLIELGIEAATPRLIARAAQSRVGSLAREAQKLVDFSKGSQAGQVGDFLYQPKVAPLSYRVAQGVGNTVGYGGAVGVETALDPRIEEGDDPGSVSSTVLQGMGLAALAEAAIIGGGAVLSRNGRRVNITEALDNYREKIELPERRQVRREALRKEFNDSVDSLSRARVALEERRRIQEAAEQLKAARQAQLTRAQETLAKRTAPGYETRTGAAMAREVERQFDQVSSRVARAGRPEIDITGAVQARVQQAVERVPKVERALKRAESAVVRTAKATDNAQERAGVAFAEAARAENTLKAWNEGWVFYPENVAALNRTLPYNPKGVWRQLQTWLMSTKMPIAKSPQDFAGKLGLTGVRLTSNLGASEAEATIQSARATDRMLQELNTAAQLRGLHKPNDGLFMEDAVDLFVKGNDGELIQKYGQQTFDHLESLSKYAESRYDELAKIGALPKMTSEQLQKLGVKRYWPQVLEDVDDDAFKEHMLNSFKTDIKRDNPRINPVDLDQQAGDKWAQFERHRESGLAGHGSFDIGRYMAGSAKDKADKGLPFLRDPMRSMEDYLVAIERKLAYGKRWGYKGDLADAAVDLVKAEGGSEAIARGIVDIFFNRKPSTAAARKIAEYMTNAQVAMKMPLSAMVNAGQGPFSIAVAGMGNTARGLSDLYNREGMQRLNHAVNLGQGLFQSLRDVQLGGYEGSNWLNRFVDRELRVGLFTPTERANRLVAGAGFGHLIHDTVAGALTGRLRGSNLEIARRLFSSKLDTNLDMLVRKIRLGGRITPEEFDRMVYRGAQLSQFMPDLTRRPAGWNTPMGRVVSQFNNFVLSHTQFMRNEILGEAARGNMAPLATMVALYPTVGEFIGSMLEEVKERPRPKPGPWRALDNFTLLGGLGMVTSLGQAAWHQRTLETGFGPTIGGTLVPIGEGTVRLAMSQDMSDIARLFMTQPLTTVLRRSYDLGEWTTSHLEDYVSTMESNTPVQGSTPEELRASRAVNKPKGWRY